MQSFLMTLLICSVTTSALALVYMAVTPLLTKYYSVTGLYYIWLVFVTGLIVPFRPRFGNAVVKVGLPGHTGMPVIRIGNKTPVLSPAPTAPPSAFPRISWWQIAAAVWLAGMVLFLAYHVLRHYRFLKRTAHWSEDITDEPTLTLFQHLKMHMGLSQNIGLQTCDSIGTPMLVGFVRPRILLPGTEFTEDELHFILKHELVHYKRNDLWYKCLVLAAAAIHWFNPVVHLMAKAIDIQCELSCDAEVVRSMGAGARLRYSETVIGVVRYQSKLKTSLSTNFYGGKSGMKKRICSIMDMNKKKIGASVLCGALILTMGTGFAFAADAASAGKQNATRDTKELNVAPWLSASFSPSPEIYAPYASYGISISEDGRSLLYKGQPVRQFVDEQADGWAFYLDENGNGNWSAVRNTSGDIIGIETMTAQQADEYYKRFFAEELDSDFIAKVNEEGACDLAMETVREEVQEGGNKYEQYQPFGLSYSAADEGLYFNGQRVKFFIDQPLGGSAETLWADDAGNVNLAATRNEGGQITGIERITDEKAQEYRSASDEYNENALNGLEDRIEARINGLSSEN